MGEPSDQRPSGKCSISTPTAGPPARQTEATMRPTYRLTVRKAVPALCLVPGDVLLVQIGSPLNMPRPVVPAVQSYTACMMLQFAMATGHISTADADGATTALSYVGMTYCRSLWEGQRDKQTLPPSTWADVLAALNNTAPAPAEPSAQTLDALDRERLGLGDSDNEPWSGDSDAWRGGK